jgi:phosphopantothenoylcysteine decarboxylase/phosphopantothenate--cysteine ligase
MGLLEGKRILLGVAGGIAAYKSPELVRRLKEAGADVTVALTEAGAQFVSPLALEVVSEHPVARSLWEPLQTSRGSRIAHTDLGLDADLIVLAPATADLIGKIRHGLADDLLTTAIMACRTPVLVCPAMNTEMLDNPLVVANLDALRALPRYTFLEPGVGLLACGIVGRGRQPDPPEIIEAAAAVLAPKDLVGLRVVLSAGPTHEPLDPVRVLANRSTGTMGFSLARSLAARGAELELVAGPVNLRTPVGVARRHDVNTAAEMHATLERLWPATDVLVMTAAVADFRPAHPQTLKIKKGGDPNSPTTPAPTLELERTVDILSTMSQKPDRARVTLVGFAAETHDVLDYARTKLEKKGLDFVIANDVSTPGVGFGPGDNAGWILSRDPDGAGSPGVIALPRAPKDRFADAIATHLAPRLRRPS